LIGYDHHTKEDEEKMIAMQENILKRAKLERKL
jgi:ssRNA-specific RNase YbeY (16S rRNA maturation enzyme)